MVRVRYIIRRLCALLLLGIILTAPTGSVAQPGQNPPVEKVNGGYALVFAGFYTGSGNGAVTPKQVIVQGRVTDETGATGNFIVRCPRNGNHFRGTGNAPGGSVTVTGRLDPYNKSLKASRLSFTYIVSGKTGRGAGHGRGGPP